MGMMWDSVGIEQGEIKVEHGRVLLDGHRTAIDEPKSKASKRTVPVEDIQPGTQHSSARYGPVRLVTGFMLGSGYPDAGLVLANAMGEPVRPELSQIRSGSCAGRPGFGRSTCTWSAIRWPTL
jgi:hypothetical protein